MFHDKINLLLSTDQIPRYKSAGDLRFPKISILGTWPVFFFFFKTWLSIEHCPYTLMLCAFSTWAHISLWLNQNVKIQYAIFRQRIQKRMLKESCFTLPFVSSFFCFVSHQSWCFVWVRQEYPDPFLYFTDLKKSNIMLFFMCSGCADYDVKITMTYCNSIRRHTEDSVINGGWDLYHKHCSLFRAILIFYFSVGLLLDAFIIVILALTAPACGGAVLHFGPSK